MKLTDLSARFLKFISLREYKMVDSLAEADGVMFQCPLCAQGKPVEEEDGRRFVRGAHSVICWFVGRVPDEATPKPGRWNPQGTGLHDLTFVGPGAASVLLTSGCNWHGFVKNGEVA